MRVIVDAFGGDNAPGEIVNGALLAAREFGVELIFVGREAELAAVLKEQGAAGFKIVDAPDIVGMEDNASSVMKEKKDSSMAVALRLLADGEGDAMVSAGSTGALIMGSTLYVKRIPGIRRAALAPMLPTDRGGAILLDSGATLECTPEYLLQFAFMGSYYAGMVLKKEDPRVGLLNVGAEDTKGDALRHETFKLLKDAGDKGYLNFTGNFEARDLLTGGADVIICDGFSGNVLLKTAEGTAAYFSQTLKRLFKKNAVTMLAALMVKGGIDDFRRRMNYKETGGAPLLGVKKPVIKAHGSADAFTFRSAIRQAILFHESGFVDSITADISRMKVPGGEKDEQ